MACSSCGAKLRVPVSADGVPRCPRCHSAAPWLVAANDADIPGVFRTSLPVLVDLWAPRCGPCRSIAPVVEQLARELAGRLKVGKVNVDESPRAAAQFDARSIPTLVIVQDGQVVRRQVGALAPHALAACVREATDPA